MVKKNKSAEESPKSGSAGVAKRAMDTAIKQMRKMHGDEVVGWMANNKKVPRQIISTGSLSLDAALVVGGLVRGRIYELFGPESGGKAQPLSSNILTPEGWRALGEVRVGNIVCAPDGTKTTIVGIYPQGKQKVYKITLDDKTSTRATAEHLWLVYTRHSELGNILTTQQLISSGLKTGNTRKYRIPLCEPVLFEEDKELPIDPYLLGLLLGDGSFRGPTIKFSTGDQVLLDRISQIFERDFSEMTISKKIGEYDYHLKNRVRNGKKTRLYKLLDSLGLMGKLSPEKEIPEVYLRSSIPQRTALLQGLMDTDGSVDSSQTISFSTSSPRLSEQFQFLSRSLGFRVTTSSRATQYTAVNGNRVDGLPSFRSSLLMQTGGIKPVSLPRKVNNLSEKQSDYRHRFIESIELCGEEECLCIKISHPDELYITDDFIVTHNTTLALSIIREAQNAGGSAIFVDAEHALDMGLVEKMGLDISRIALVRGYTGEQNLDVAEALMSTGVFDICVIDSVAALQPSAEANLKSFNDNTMGLHPRLMARMCRTFTSLSSRTQTAFVLINQVRANMSGYGNPKTTAGGFALRHHMSGRIQISGGGTKSSNILSSTGLVIGHRIGFKVVKNKLGPPFREAETDLIYGKGFHREAELLDLGVEMGFVDQAGAWFSVEEEKIGQGRAKAVQTIVDNNTLREELQENVCGVLGLSVGTPLLTEQDE